MKKQIKAASNFSLLAQDNEVILQKTYVSKENVGLCLQLSPLIYSNKQAVKCSNALSLNLQKIYKRFVTDFNQEIQAL